MGFPGQEERAAFGVTPAGVSLQASEVERQLSLQVHTLREDFREKNSSSSQHIVRLESLQAEVSHLPPSCRKQPGLLELV